MKQVSWKSRDGRDITVTITAEAKVYTSSSTLDGDQVSNYRTADLSVEIIARLEGKDIGRQSGRYLQPSLDYKNAYRLGKLVILPENASRVLQAIDDEISEVEAAASEEYRTLMARKRELEAARRKREEERLNEARELEAHRRRNGYCPKCKTYCYGDCSAN